MKPNVDRGRQWTAWLGVACRLLRRLLSLRQFHGSAIWVFHDGLQAPGRFLRQRDDL